MVDASNDELLNNINKKNMIFFDSISEKQEESSNSSVKNSKIAKSKGIINNNNKNSLKSNNISKEAIDINNISIRKKKRSTKKNSFISKKRKTIFIKEGDEENDKNKLRFRLSETKKKTQFMLKRTSFKPDFNLFSKQLKIEENLKKRQHSINNLEQLDSNLNVSALKEQKSLNYSLSNSKIGMTSLYNRNSIVGMLPLKNRNTILSNSDYLDKKYFSNIKKKNTILMKKTPNLKNQNNFNYTNLFEKLKDSYLFEKSEIALFRIKICYGFLAFFSFISIILSIADVIIFNNESKEFLNVNYKISMINNINIDNYYFIEKRKISKRENTIRTFNLIFSLLAFISHLIIHFIKNKFDKETKKKNKKKNYYNYINRRRKTNKFGMNEQNNMTNENKLKIIEKDDYAVKNFVTRREKIKLVINCIISISFYPPGINKVFVGFEDNVIYVYSLNSLFLLITIFKLANIYFAMYYLSPFNNLLYKTICSSNMVKMNFKFVFILLLNLYPLEFILFNFIFLGLVICILIFSFEYFSININGIWNNKGENDLKSFHNVIYLYCFFIIKSVYGNIKANTILGALVLLIGGTIGVFINSYFIYYLSQFIEFKPEEQQAYTKLIKLFNPLNNEHKASNLVKIFLLMKKMYIDNQNIEEEYKLKKESHLQKIIQKSLRFKKSKFNFLEDDDNNSLSNVINNNEYKEKIKLLKYISTEFVLKIKLLIESKNFKNIYLVARNYSLSFNDVLKTLEDKMNGNINQLNNKLEVFIKNDEKFKSFMKNQDHTSKKIKKIMAYQDILMNYLIEKNNEETIGYIKEIKDIQNNYINKSKNPEKLPRRMKSLINGSIFSFARKRAKIKNSNEGELDDNKKTKESKSPKSLFKSQKTFGFKRLKSSVITNKANVNNINNMNNISKKIALIKCIKNKNKKSNKSLDDSLFKSCQKRKSINKIESHTLENIRSKTHSLSGKQKEIIEKLHAKIENKTFFELLVK